MVDLTLQIREAVVARMQASLGITALIPAGSIYGERVPDDRSYPFIRTGEQTVRSFPIGCADDGAYDITIHAFVNGLSSDAAALVGAAIREEFDANETLKVLGDLPVSMDWRGGGIVRDPDEPDIWHAFVDYTVA